MNFWTGVLSCFVYICELGVKLKSQVRKFLALWETGANPIYNLEIYNYNVCVVVGQSFSKVEGNIFVFKTH
jgi:hypothetical protein